MYGTDTHLSPPCCPIIKSCCVTVFHHHVQITAWYLALLSILSIQSHLLVMLSSNLKEAAAQHVVHHFQSLQA